MKILLSLWSFPVRLTRCGRSLCSLNHRDAQNLVFRVECAWFKHAVYILVCLEPPCVLNTTSLLVFQIFIVAQTVLRNLCWLPVGINMLSSLCANGSYLFFICLRKLYRYWCNFEWMFNVWSDNCFIWLALMHYWHLSVRWVLIWLELVFCGPCMRCESCVGTSYCLLSSCLDIMQWLHIQFVYTLRTAMKCFVSTTCLSTL